MVARNFSNIFKRSVYQAKRTDAQQVPVSALPFVESWEIRLVLRS
jgi:hypothetical protein